MQANVVEVAEGAEPPFFTALFAGWDATARVSVADQVEKMLSLKQQASSGSPAP